MDLANESILTETAPRQIYVLTPDNPPWNGWVAIGVWVLSVVIVLATPIIFVTPYLFSQKIDLTDSPRLREFLLRDPTAVMLQLAPIILAHGLTILVAWFVVTHGNTYSFRETLGWKMGKFRWWHAVLITFAFYALAVLLMSVFTDVENEFEVMIKSSKYAVYLVAFFATFTAPLVEEVIYRGLLYSSFQRRFGAGVAISLVTILFTIVHVPQYSVGATPDYATVIALLLLSLTLTCLRAATKNLLPCIVLHTVFNGLSSAMLLAEPYLKAVEPVVPPPGIVGL